MAVPATTPSPSPGTAPAPPRTRWQSLRRQLYFWVLLGIAVGIVVGAVAPGVGSDLKPIGDTFVNAIKMVITPIIFVTVVAGIAGVADLRGVGRIGGKAILYFEAVTTLALVLGLVVMNLLKPGEGVHAVAAGGQQDGRRLRRDGQGAEPLAPAHRRRAEQRRRARSPRATSCRCCSSRCCSGSRSRRSARPASRWPAASTTCRS